ncbi:nuclear transport factor 2 family protein [Anderseniella sp. Alg231-50]|uniref:nuclear transport factor 2 family protein n=1 Tax=Anderseniella sp. Alg231-50 TaxID=1922226 RepID=UPI000D550E94
MSVAKKDQICALLKSIETGDPGPVAVVNEARYVQHNPQTHEGSEGLAALFERLSKTSPRVNIVRVFEDGDFVFAHTEYDFARRNIGFEVFRFEDGQAVEHWDNIQHRADLNQSGRGMVDGPTGVEDHELTELNRELVRSYIENVLLRGDLDSVETYVGAETYAEHNPRMGDGLALLRGALGATHNGHRIIDYQRIHRVLAEGNFVLSVSEGYFYGEHSSFYDLFRVSNGKVVEHWDTTERIAPRSEWKNNNGKF